MRKVKLILILLNITFAISAVLSKSVYLGGKSEKEFTHLGSFKSMALGKNGESFDENDYYLSLIPAPWITAESDCKLLFGINASTVTLESAEEWDFLKTALQSREGTYWTNGAYNPQASQWIWYITNHFLPPWAPWASGHPSANANTQLRVIIEYTSRFSNSWRTVLNTQMHRYICEMHRATIAVPCYRTNDLIVVLDSSGSVELDNFEIAKGFIDELAAAFTVHRDSRLAFIVYSTSATVVIDITNTFSRGEISYIIRATPYDAGSTYTNLGIDLAISQFISSPRQVPLNMVVLTDGQSSAPDLTVAAANRAISMGVRTFSVGITTSINQQELLSIAGGNPNRVFSTDNFDELIKLLAPLSLKICTD